MKFKNRFKGTQNNRTPDFNAANKILEDKFPDKTFEFNTTGGTFKVDGKEYIWHHHQDMKSLLPVRVEAHNKGIGGVAHVGGIAVKEHNIGRTDELIFPSPYSHDPGGIVD